MKKRIILTIKLNTRDAMEKQDRIALRSKEAPLLAN
jgi:hypothetical protein